MIVSYHYLCQWRKSAISSGSVSFGVFWLLFKMSSNHGMGVSTYWTGMDFEISMGWITIIIRLFNFHDISDALMDRISRPSSSSEDGAVSQKFGASDRSMLDSKVHEAIYVFRKSDVFFRNHEN
ncbi:uncharacterized protein LOC120173825 isoform X2 [Hibiscus syriacus]|uniref:uncharacterized protein LOC120173825 isoform X2 n=1 Tax=Hibiscus syriacus TaxID=106335 RepID=UPI001923BF7F|nr:uncharacterized protein LOC120173825 isoform X2 [Hibiscus syriacus]